MASTPATSLTRISSGLQDARLQPPLGNPSVDQFVHVLRKTTRWAAQWRRVDFDGSPEFGQRVSLTLPRIAELVSGVTLVVEMPDIQTPQTAAQAAAGADFLGPFYGWTNSLGHALIDRVELEIGGAIIETLDGRLLEVLDEFYEPVETMKAKNRMICRAAAGFTAKTFVAPTTVYVPLPFWFSKPGRLSHALPLDALSAEKVRIHVVFRPVEQLYYTDARMDSRTVGFRPGIDVDGGMPALQGGRFWVADPSSANKVYSMSAEMPTDGILGKVLEGFTMPTRLRMESAYMLTEYISLEEPESIGFRTAELTYIVEQHRTIPVQPTLRGTEIRITLPTTNPTKEVLWCFQRPEAEAYNAWFLFTREIDPYVPTFKGSVNPCLVPWWPDADLTPRDANGWSILPAFRGADSEPLGEVAMYYNTLERFIHRSGSLFRSLIPTKYAVKAPVHDRYIYMWSFEAPQDIEKELRYPRGTANWDKITKKEMYFTMRRGRGGVQPPNMNLYVWTTTWNILKVFGGRGSMLFTY